MSKDPLLATGTKVTPQSEQARPEQVKNNAGGFVFEIPAQARVHRFLIGAIGGTFYVKEHALTKDNAKVVTDFARNDARTLVEMAMDISIQGRAPRNNPALYALAAASALGNENGRKAAFNALPLVARTGTHLFTWAGYRELFGGWGRGAARAVSNWYLEKDPDDLAHQMIKYRQREGWRHRDLLRLSHPRRQREVLGEGISPRQGMLTDDAHAALFDFVCERNLNEPGFPQVIHAFNEAWEIERDAGLTDAQRTRRWVALIASSRLPWEAFPDRALTKADVWRALIETGMPQTALLRQLPRLTTLGVLQPLSEHLRLVTDQLADSQRLIRARVHPIAVLIALKTYAQGHSMRGDSTWTPVSQVIDALSDAFYLAYGAVEPANKRTMLALDVSGSMTWCDVAGVKGLTPREASAALALVTAATEKDHLITGFCSDNGRGEGISGLSISPKQRLDDAVKTVANLYAGGTDCALPMLWAAKNNIKVDTFEILTDNETWAGTIHPFQALRQYRDKTGIAARLVVVGMTSTGFSIADPDDPGSLDVAGFDGAVPSLIANFSRGDI